jgi:acyl carrier protein
MTDTATLPHDQVIGVLQAEIRRVKDTLPAEVPTDALLMTDLGLDSLDCVEFVARVEELYRLAVPDDDWQSLTTLDRIAEYVVANAGGTSR